jgi:excisionase family DNA binding protein
MMPDVLTLEEVAGCLRLSKETIQREAIRGRIPGRQIDDTWRFLKVTIDNWLRSRDSRLILSNQRGHWQLTRPYRNCGLQSMPIVSGRSMKKTRIHNAPARH